MDERRRSRGSWEVIVAVEYRVKCLTGLRQVAVVDHVGDRRRRDSKSKR